jgi:hypothetical protein
LDVDSNQNVSFQEFLMRRVIGLSAAIVIFRVGVDAARLGWAGADRRVQYFGS